MQITLLNSNAEALELILRYLGMGEPEEKSGLIGRVRGKGKESCGKDSSVRKEGLKGMGDMPKEDGLPGRLGRKGRRNCGKDSSVWTEDLAGRGSGLCGGKTVLEEPLRSADSLEIEFRNVSFTYPGTESKALDNLSFAIHPGEKLAVVGVNGSGKTTMIKLLCGLYEPDRGGDPGERKGHPGAGPGSLPEAVRRGVPGFPVVLLRAGAESGGQQDL